MFAWLANWIRRKLQDRRRAIFRYWDGRRWRGADPLVAFRRMLNHPRFDPDTHLAAADRGDQEALSIVVEATREIFEIPAWRDDQQGLTEAETLNLIGEFIEYLNALKKNGSRSPTSPESTGPGSSTPTNDVPTNAESVSGSIESERPEEPPSCC